MRCETKGLGAGGGGAAGEPLSGGVAAGGNPVELGMAPAGLAILRDPELGHLIAALRPVRVRSAAGDERLDQPRAEGGPVGELGRGGDLADVVPVATGGFGIGDVEDVLLQATMGDPGLARLNDRGAFAGELPDGGERVGLV
jgi:hypothetical protein